MKVLMKKLTVIAAAFAMLFAVSSCSDPNGKANPDKKAGDNTTTAAAADAASDTGSTSGGEQSSGGGQSGESGSGGQGTQTKTVTAVFSDLNEFGITITCYSDNTWKEDFYMFGQTIVGATGTYIGNPAQDGDVSITVTKEKADDSFELVDCTPETNDITITDGIFGIYDEDDGSTQYFIKKANLLETFSDLYITDYSTGTISYFKFYDDNRWRIYKNGIIDSIGTYSGDTIMGTSVNANTLSITDKYILDWNTGLLEPSSNTTPYNLSIGNANFTHDGVVYNHEVAVFKAVDEGTNLEDYLEYFVRFYADKTFLVTYVDVYDIPLYFGETTELIATGNQTLSYTINNQYDENPNKVNVDDPDYVWWPMLHSQTSIGITNNQFSLTIIQDGEPVSLTFTRQ